MSGSKYILTLDVGSGSVRAILFNIEGDQIATCQREWLPVTIPEYPGSQDFDTGATRGLLVKCIREVIVKSGVKPDEISGVTATSLREGIVLYDKKQKVIWACTNTDARATREVEEMVAEGLGEPVYRTGGDWLNIISPARFRWIKGHMPDVYERIDRVNMISDWVLYMLSGSLVTEPSCGSSSGIFDLKERTWSKELIELIGLPEDIYAPVYEPGSIIGEVSENIARETGLKAGTPVITGGGDTQMGLTGSGSVRPGLFTIVGGTFWQTALVTDYPLIDPEFRLRTLCHAVPGQWMIEGIGFFHGFTMRWFRDGFCQTEKKEALLEGADPYDLMEKLASGIPPGSNGVQAIFSNIMNARQWKHAVPSFVGFDLMRPESTGKAACIRALEEHAAYTSRAHYKILTDISGLKAGTITFCGGSSRGTLWPGIIADVLGVPVRVPVVKESTALGAAMFAGMALGWYSAISEASDRLVKWERVIEPDIENMKAYDEHYERWCRVYPYLMSMADDGILPSMWRAPGV